MTETALTATDAPPAEDSALAPLRRPGFRAAWTALAGSQLVIWMNTVGAVTVILGGKVSNVSPVENVLVAVVVLPRRSEPVTIRV